MNNTPKKLTAWLTINRSCNLRCRWCYAKMTGFERDDMSAQTLKHSLDLFQSLGIAKVIILGGEPTIHPQFFEILEQIQERGMGSYLVTNAVILADRNGLDSMIARGVAAITVSLKAFDHRSYSSLTRSDVFEQVKKAIRNLQQVEVPSVVNVTLSKETIENIDQLIELMGETGAKTFSLDTGKPIIFPDGSTSMEGMGSLEDLASFFSSTYEKLKESGLTFSFKIAIPFCLFSESFIQQIITDGNLLTGCQMATGRGVIIDPKGHIIPCNHLCNLALGNVSEINHAESFEEFRTQSAVNRFYQKVATCPSVECVSCKYWQICGSGCRLYWLHYGKSIAVHRQ